MKRLFAPVAPLFLGSLLLASGPGGAPAQEVVRARFEIDLTRENEARVTARYELRGGGTAVPLRLMTFGDTRVDSVRVRSRAGGATGRGGGSSSPLTLREVRPRIHVDTMELPGAGGGAVGEDGLVPIAFEYTILGALEDRGSPDLRWRIPVLQVGQGVAEAIPGAFQARVLLPPDVEAYESFPTGIRALDGTGDAGTARIQLQVVPAVVTLRARRGGAPLLPPLKLLDGAIVLVLIGLGGAGWRYLARLGG